jgi:hypothetical protein
MQNRKRTAFLGVTFATFLAASARAESAATASPPGASGTESIVGFRETAQPLHAPKDSLLYLTYNTSRLAASTFTVGSFVSDFGSTRFYYPAADFFGRLISLADSESASPWRKVSLWWRYSFGVGVRKGSAVDTSGANTSPLPSTLLLMNSRIGAVLTIELAPWLLPYAGIEINPFYYRHTAAVDGADQDTWAYTYGPVLGAHLPLFFDGAGTLMAELRFLQASSAAKPVLANSTSLTAGAGISF